MVLRRDGDAQRTHTRELIGLGDEEVLDGPALAFDRLITVGGLVRVEHLIDRRVAHGVRRHAPAEPVELTHHRHVLAGRNDLDAFKGAATPIGLGVRLAHVPAFEAAINQRLHAADAQPLVAFIGTDVPARDQRLYLVHAREVEDAHEVIHAHREAALALELLEHAVARDLVAAELERARHADAGEARRIQQLHLGLDRLRGELRGRRQLDEAARGVDQLAVQAAVGLVPDLAARRTRHAGRDVPARGGGGIDDELVPAAHQHHRIIRRHAVELLEMRQALLVELGLVPVAVRDDQLAGRSAFCFRLYRPQELIDAAHP